MTSKYIVYLYKGLEVIIIFSEVIQHSDIAKKLVESEDYVISAGFIRLDFDNKLCCYGESISLNKKSRPEKDSKLASVYL